MHGLRADKRGAARNSVEPSGFLTFAHTLKDCIYPSTLAVFQVYPILALAGEPVYLCGCVFLAKLYGQVINIQFAERDPDFDQLIFAIQQRSRRRVPVPESHVEGMQRRVRSFHVPNPVEFTVQLEDCSNDYENKVTDLAALLMHRLKI